MSAFEKLPAASIGVAVARGFAAVGTALGLGSRVFSSGGRRYHFKGPDWMREVKEIKGAVSAEWETGLLKEYILDMEKPGDDKSSFPKRSLVRSVRK